MSFHVKYCFLPLLCLLFTTLHSQEPKPTARFSFNNGSDEDEISHKKPRLLSTRFVNDRFGNPGSAIYLFGDHDSHINLGNYPALKPKKGSISIWVKVETYTYSGSGITVNPIISTRNCSCSDYNEAYGLYLNLYARSFEGLLSNDSLKQVVLKATSREIEIMNWHHLVLTYDRDSAAIYLNGKLELSIGKKFDSHFEATDSVMVGLIFNQKNKRVLRGMVDDIEFYDKVLTAEEVNKIYHAPNPNAFRVLLNKILWAIAICLALTGIYLIIRWRFNLLLRKEKQRLALANILLENELRVNRALMNPHFMFNSLNTLHHHILTGSTDAASHYLIKFSRLIRKILDTNMSDAILLEQEIELLDNYLEIESLRFKENLQYSLKKDADVVPSAITIPIMMLQPFIENSVWHGLREKSGEKIIAISFSLHGEDYIQCVIEDNGTGRKPKKIAGTEKKSLATNFVMQRLALLNKIYSLECRLSIIDKENGQGTIVQIILPILNKINTYASTSDHY